MLVGEVRCATTGFGIFLEVVGRQHVVRRPSRRSRRSARCGARSAAARARRLGETARCRATRRRQADPPARPPARRSQSSTNGSGDRPGVAARPATTSAATAARARRRRAMLPVEAGEVELRLDRRLRGRHPFEQVAARHEQPARACGRWRRAISQAWCGEEGDRQAASATQREAQIAGRARAGGCAARCPARRGTSAERATGRKRRDRERRERRSAVHSSAAGGGSSQPTARAPASVSGASSDAAQVVEHLPAAERRQRALAVRAAEDPGQQLPVAARPAVLARRGDVVARGELLDHLDVGDEPGAREDALEEIVAQQRVLGHAAGERRLEGIDVVDALAGVGAFAEEVLVDVGDRGGVGIDAARAGERCAGRASPRGRPAATA